MKLSLLGTAGCLARCGSCLWWVLVVSAKCIREAVHKQEFIWPADSVRVGDILVFDCGSGCSRSL